jgi:DeoR family transcriptional regulator of aga operon
MNYNTINDNTIDRRQKILEIINQQNQVKVNDLSKIFNVSEVTIRNDLSQLEAKHMLIKTRGGALKSQNVGLDPNLEIKKSQNLKEKQLIGIATSKLINDGDTIILDSGTTTLEVAKNLQKFNELTIITNALNIVSELIQYPNFNVIIPGGILRRKSLSLIGHSAESTLKNYYCDKLIMGIDGIDLKYGITTPNIEEANLNKTMIEIARELIVVADSSKFGKRSLAFISKIDIIKTLVTDKKISEVDLKKLNEVGVHVIVV